MVYFQYLPIQSEQRKTFLGKPGATPFAVKANIVSASGVKLKKPSSSDKNTPSKEFVSAADLSMAISSPKFDTQSPSKF